jgi:glycosyltransferase involved in cell wall biosynthesis
LLAEKGHDVKVLTTGPRLQAGCVAERRGAVRVYRHPAPNVYGILEKTGWRRRYLKPLWHAFSVCNPFFSNEFKRAILQSDADVVHVHNLSGIGYNALRLVGAAGLPAVLTLHDLGLVCMNQAMFYRGAECSRYHTVCALTKNVKAGFLARIKRLSLCAPSEAIMSAVLRHLPPFNGIRRIIKYPLLFPPAPPALPPASSPRFLFVGQIEETKGVRFLLEVLHPILEARGGVLTLLGTGRLFAELSARYEGSPNVIFRGFVSQEVVSREIATAHALLIPSLWLENSPLVAYHALSYGVPVIASRIGGLPELVLENESGLLLPPGDTAAWRVALDDLAAHPAKLETLRRRSGLLKDRFDPRRLVDEIVDLYQETRGLDRSGALRSPTASLV